MIIENKNYDYASNVFGNWLCSDFVDWDIGRVEKSSTY